MLKTPKYSLCCVLICVHYISFQNYKLTMYKIIRLQ
jgi:hypothetical protein